MAMGFMERLRNTDDVLIGFSGMQTLLVDEYEKPMEEHLSVWIVAHPEEFQDCLRRIYATGHDIAPIGTQASSPFRAAPFGKTVVDRVYELNYESAKLAKEVTPEGHYITGHSNPAGITGKNSISIPQVDDGIVQFSINQIATANINTPKTALVEFNQCPALGNNEPADAPSISKGMPMAKPITKRAEPPRKTSPVCPM